MADTIPLRRTAVEGGFNGVAIQIGTARMAMEAGAPGLIFGHNIWQREHDESLRFVARLRELLEKYSS
ncbi:MAG TPA: hypothetical protein VE776_01545 [Actinomycetota bacterium]|jgi:class I fructose-bisphosphate aldolase|nr:hypothetical protein [Actinomycetota bacterium]